MTNELIRPSGQRLISLDVFRGLTLAGMIVVNNQNEKMAYAPLRHAEWNGWTLTDLVFPFFLFIVGTSIALAFAKRRARGDSRQFLLLHAVRRCLVLLALAMFYAGFRWANVFDPQQNHWQLLISFALVVVGLGLIWPEEGSIARAGWGRASPRVIIALLVVAGGIFAFIYYRGLFTESKERIPGVLQRIAICYLFASIIVLYFGVPGRIFWVIACLAGYWAIMHYVQPPAGFVSEAFAPEGRLHDWIDQVFGTHLYSHRPDPEGLLSTLPAIATTLLGVLAGNWLTRDREEHEKTSGLFVAGLLLFGAGLVLDRWIPINKKIWSDSYVLLAGGLSFYVLGLCYLIVDVEGWRRWAGPFRVLGTNAIAIYILSGITASYILVREYTVNGQAFVPARWCYDHLQTVLREQLHILNPAAHSLVFSLAYVALWMLIFWPLYRGRLFIKV